MSPPNDTQALQDRIDAMFDSDLEKAGEALAATLPPDFDPYGKDAFALQSGDRPRVAPPVTTFPAADFDVDESGVADDPGYGGNAVPNDVSSLPVLDDCATGHCVRPENLPPPEPQLKPLYAGVVQIPAPAHWQEAIDDFRHGNALVDKDRYNTDWQRKHEKRADLESLDYLLAYRSLLVERLSPLAAMHKHEGKWDEVRRAVRGMIAAEIRKDPKAFGFKDGKPPGVEAVTDAACADPRYVDAVRKARLEAIEYENLNHELANLDFRIRAREIANLQHNAEARLQ